MSEYQCDQTIEGLELILTCTSHPEQYDVYDSSGQVAYFRLRNGRFRAHVPDARGAIVYTDLTRGDGLFDKNERQFHLEKAVDAVNEALRRNE